MAYTTEQAAKILGVNDSRVRQMVRQGIIKAEKHGRDWLIPASEVEKAKKRKTTRGPDRKK